jgi:hypothetical protein
MLVESVAKMVPPDGDDQKQGQLGVRFDLYRQLAEGNNFLDRVITGDEVWCFQYDPETKRQSFFFFLSSIYCFQGENQTETPKHTLENISITETKKGTQTHVTSPSGDNAHSFF